jgi:HPt (histidine-containing phosphotransfer) domain-containing protein
VPIIAVTAQVLDSRWALWRAAGIDEYLAKPYQRAELLNAVALAVLPPAPRPHAAEHSSPAMEDALPVLDSDIVAQLDACMAPEKMAAHLAALGADIETLLALLHEGECRANTQALETIAHRIAGDGGQLGFTALSAAAHRYEMARQQDGRQLPSLAAALRETAENALEALCQRQDLTRRAAMPSAKLP